MDLLPRYRAMADRIARAYSMRLPRHIHPDDIHQAALIGLFDGLRRKPGQSGPAYEFYLRMRIRGEIIEELRRHNWGNRRHYARMVGLDDVDPFWESHMPGVSENPEQRAIQRLDAQKAWSAALLPACRRMAERVFLRGSKQSDIALDEHVSEPRVNQRLHQALGVMRQRLLLEPVLLTARVKVTKAKGT